MTAKAKVWTAIFSSAFVIAGCNSKELSRSKAKDIIQASSDMAPGQSVWTIDQKSFQCGITKGLWPGTYQFDFILNPSAKPYVVNLTEHSGKKQIKLAKPMDRSVDEITGISDAPAQFGPNTKHVDYTWHWKTDTFKRDNPADLVECLSPLISNPTPDKVVMKLYDDGWRVVHYDPYGNEVP